MLGAVGLVLFASATSPYVQLIAGTVLIYAISAIGLNLVMGQAGPGLDRQRRPHGGGRPTRRPSSPRARRLGVFPIPILASAVVGGLVGLLIALPALRLKGIYLALATLALQFFVVFAGDRYQQDSGLLSGVPVAPLSIAGHSVRPRSRLPLPPGRVPRPDDPRRPSHVTARPRRMWTAIRESELAATAIGVNAARWKLLAFVVSSAIIAVSGSLFAYYNQIVSAESFTLEFAVVFIIILILGGMGRSRAPSWARHRGLAAHLLTHLTSNLPSGAVGQLALVEHLPRQQRALRAPRPRRACSTCPRAWCRGHGTGQAAVVQAFGSRRCRGHRARRPAVRGGAPRTVDDRAGSAPVRSRTPDVMYETGARAVRAGLHLRVEPNTIVAVLGHRRCRQDERPLAAERLPADRAGAPQGRHPLRRAGHRRDLPRPHGRPRGLVLVPERDKIFPSLTVHEHLKLAVASGYEGVIDKPYFRRLKDRLEQPAGLLSGGDAPLLALATASRAQAQAAHGRRVHLGRHP